MTRRQSEGCALDAWLYAQLGARASLCPGRDQPTSFAALWSQLALDEARSSAVFCATQRVLQAIATHFPDNVFWDLDLVVQALADRATREDIDVMGARLVGLIEGFGIHSEIRFRYIHDFTYGFDWAKWVAKAPQRRAEVKPFGDRFLTYLERRRAELLQLIAKDDETYGRLPDARPRNPFGFSREPAAERQLHEALAARGLIPVATWERHGRARWGAHFAEHRREVAVQLGLGR